MSRRLLSLGSAAMVVLLIVGVAALAYARWAVDVAGADRAISQGRFDQATAAYVAAERRFDRFPFTKQLFADEYRTIEANQMWLLYRLGRFDDAIDRAERTPDAAGAHFWAGCALFDKAHTEDKPDARLALVVRAQDEFRRALDADPDNLDIKFDYELTTRLTSESRRQAKAPPKQMMQLLRPEPKKADKPTRRVG
jgi:tetratricopeptide (TPR) repeat protein